MSPDQRTTFLKMHQHGARIFILYDENDYPKIFQKPNWAEHVMFPGDSRLPKGFRHHDPDAPEVIK